MSLALRKRPIGAIMTAAGYGKAYKYLKTGYGIAGKVPKAMQAYKRARLAAKRSFGQKKQRIPSKFVEETNQASFQMTDGRTQYIKRLCDIPLNEATVSGTTVNTSDSRTARRRDVVNLTGFKFCFEITNNDQDTNNQPAYVNFAVVVDKESSSSDVENLDHRDFFRNQKGSDRSIDFSSTGLTSNELHCLPINTDKLAVLTHRRFLIGPNNNNSVGNMSRHKNMDFFLKCKRQLRWDEGNVYPEGPGVYAVMWCSRFGDGASPTNPTNPLVKMDGRILTYFRG